MAKTQAERDGKLHIEYDYGNFFRFYKMTVNDLRWMLEHGFILSGDGHQGSPSTNDFLEFMVNQRIGTKATAVGMGTRLPRDDFGLIIDGIEIRREQGHFTKDEIQSFLDFADSGSYFADEFDVGFVDARIWWD